MVDLRTRFGRLVKSHRVRAGLTQEALAERANISTDMISKIEGGSSGARFAVISQIANALEVDPAELFTPNLPAGQLQIGRASCRERVVSTCRSRWSPYHYKKNTN